MPTSFPSPSSSSSVSTTETDTDTILPTPDQSHPSRQSSITSPTLYNYHLTMSGRGQESEGDLFSPSSSMPNGRAGSVTPQPKGIPSISTDPVHPDPASDLASPTPFSRRRSNTANRAPPPPPIFLRRPTGMDNDENEAVPVPGSASTASQPGSARGLNITGMTMPTMSPADAITIERGEEDEGGDALPELMASPRPRLNFNTAEGAPASPAWQSFESQPSPAGLNSSTSWGRKSSLDVPSPLGPRHNERKFEPTPQHGLHARNLSLFFPQPGAVPQPRPNGSPMLMESPVQPGDTLMPSAAGERGVFGGSGDWTFGQSQASGLEEQNLQTPEGVKRSKRRGHHHKHSLSHNFFSFLDPTQTNPALASAPSPNPAPSLGPEATPAPVPMPRLAPPEPHAASPTLSPLPPPKSDHRGQLLTSFAVLEFLIGAGLWVEGQMSGWRCLAGVGYLVVFDAIGVAVETVARGEGQGWSSIRRPFGPSRYISLLYFAQSLFLVFAAVYIAKESLEQVILGAGAHEHAVGGHGHGNSAVEGDERAFPHFLLFCAGTASVFAGGVLGNHGKLVDAVGSLFLTSTYLSLPFVSKLPSLFANPFTLTIAGASTGILFSTLLVPPSALHSLDSFISLVLTILTSALSYPPTVAFAHVLLQTAPPSTQGQMTALRQAIREIKDDRRVVGLGTMRCWTITAGKGSYDERYPSGGSPENSRNNSFSGSTMSPRFSYSSMTPAPSPPARQSSFSDLLQSSGKGSFSSSYPSPYGYPPGSGPGWKTSASEKEDGAPLVVTLTVHVHPDLGDREVLEITKFAYVKLESAVSGSGIAALSSRRDGEVSVQIKRGWEGLEDG